MPRRHERRSSTTTPTPSRSSSTPTTSPIRLGCRARRPAIGKLYVGISSLATFSSTRGTSCERTQI